MMPRELHRYSRWASITASLTSNDSPFAASTIREFLNSYHAATGAAMKALQRPIISTCPAEAIASVGSFRSRFGGMTLMVGCEVARKTGCGFRESWVAA